MLGMGTEALEVSKNAMKVFGANYFWNFFRLMSAFYRHIFQFYKSYKSNFGSCDLTNCLSTCLMVKKGPKKGTSPQACLPAFAGRRQFGQSWAGKFLSDKLESELVSFPLKQHKQNKQVLLDFLTKNSSRLILTYSSTNTRESHRGLTFWTSSPGEDHWKHWGAPFRNGELLLK